ncbi:hypothetical protein BLNAU_9315 [Blattamonas nauphoetae]|uniref:Uncharacterized protein n=1 Tax=Blattamonas nauphoetae TaxID=2049346 RepID=A0ABQ9XWC6_9EUKA|nr:hypothetical protein BLNAU_9315 [Blattamonas nauphoetae]
MFSTTRGSRRVRREERKEHSCLADLPTQSIHRRQTTTHSPSTSLLGNLFEEISGPSASDIFVDETALGQVDTGSIEAMSSSIQLLHVMDATGTSYELPLNSERSPGLFWGWGRGFFIGNTKETSFPISESPPLPTTVADDESFHFHHPLPSFASPTFRNDRPPSRNQNISETDAVLPALDILRVFSLVTQPALVSILTPLPIDTHVKFITSIFTVVSAVRLFTNSFRPHPQREVQDGRGANRTAGTSPRDTTLTSQLTGQFAALVLVSFFRDHFAGFTIQRAHSTSSSSLINTPTIIAADSTRSSASFNSPLPSTSLNNLESNLFLSRPATNPNTKDPILHYDRISSGTYDLSRSHPG